MSLWDFLDIKSYHLKIDTNFITSFLILLPFISSSCLIASCTMLNRNSESGILVLFLILKNKLSDFHCCMMLALSLSYMAFIILRYIPYLPNLLGFYHEWKLNFVKLFFCFYWNYDFLITVMYHIYWNPFVEPSLCPRD